MGRIRIHNKRRLSTGVYLLEVLFAVLISGILVTMLSAILSSTMKEYTSDQNSQMANTIAEELIDYTRSMNYSTLLNNIGTYQLYPISSPPAIRTPPVTIDLFNKIWSAQSNSFVFPGTVVYSIQPGGTGILTVAVLVTWTDSTNKNRQILTSTVVVQNGTRYWN